MSSQKRKNLPDNSLSRTIGIVLLCCGVFIALKTFYPVASAEVRYQTAKILPLKKEIIPVNTDFSIVIPKIGVNTNVIKNVDPNNASEYQKALTRGVAHAKGSSLPGFPGNVFIFAHSALNWYQANQYNAVFYLTDKLEVGDKIDIYYDKSQYTYSVTDKKIVKSTEINYLKNSSTASTLTLMTCWPPGTTLNRLVVVAKAK